MKDNTSIGIDPNDDTAAIMAEIDKNIQEEQEAGTFGKDVDKKDYIDPRIDGLENLEDLEQANIADDEAVEEKKDSKKDFHVRVREVYEQRFSPRVNYDQLMAVYQRAIHVRDTSK